MLPVYLLCSNIVIDFIQCMSDLLALLILLGVNNVPRSWHHLKHLIETTTLETSCLFSCSCCDSASINSSKCSTCGHNFSSDVVRNSFLTVPIKHHSFIHFRFLFSFRVEVVSASDRRFHRFRSLTETMTSVHVRPNRS